jgi:hypothetical protein
MAGLRKLANIILRRIMIEINQAARTPSLRGRLLFTISSTSSSPFHPSKEKEKEQTHRIRTELPILVCELGQAGPRTTLNRLLAPLKPSRDLLERLCPLLRALSPHQVEFQECAQEEAGWP